MTTSARTTTAGKYTVNYDSGGKVLSKTLNTAPVQQAQTPQQKFEQARELSKTGAPVSTGRGYFESGAYKVGTPSSGITSSAGPVISNQINQAVNTAGSAITTQPQSGDTNSLSNMSLEQISQYINSITQPKIDAATKNAERAMQARKLTYDSALAQVNQKYGQLQKQLQDNLDKSSQVALEDAIALNPYSTARGARTADNFQNKINQNYEAASAQLQQQADMAQQALAAGEYEAYAQIQANLDNIIADVTSETANLLLDFRTQAEQSRQFDETQELNKVSSYVDVLAKTGAPSMDALNQMSDEELMQLPAVKAGLRAGYDIDGIRQDLMNASQIQEQANRQTLLENEYRQAQIDKVRNDITIDSAQASFNKQKAGVGIQQPLSSDSRLAGLQNFVLSNTTDKDYPIIWNNVKSGYDAAQNKQDFADQYVKARLSEKEISKYQTAEDIANLFDIATNQIDSGGFTTGPVKATLQNVLKTIGKQDQYYDATRSLFSKGTAEERLRIFGATLTSGEKSSAAQFLPSDKDTTSVLKYKLDSLKGLAQLSMRRTLDTKLGIDYSAASNKFLSDRINGLKSLQSGKPQQSSGTSSSPGAQQQAGLLVQYNGKTYSFPTKEAASKFKAQLNIE